MLRARLALRAKPNDKLVKRSREPGQGNLAWLRDAFTALGPNKIHVVLIGGSGLCDFRLRVAQSRVRGDMRPSHWSHTITVAVQDPPVVAAAWHVDLPRLTDFDHVPRTNAVQNADLALFDDPARFPNVAALHFPSPPHEPAVRLTELIKMVEDLKKSRLVEDLVTPLVRWLGFVWGSDEAVNPFVNQVPMPSARLTELIFASLGIDINPGTAGHFTCPETLWHAAMWWSDYYRATAPDDPNKAVIPGGYYTREPFLTLPESNEPESDGSASSSRPE